MRYPKPAPNPADVEHWDRLLSNEFVVQQCVECGNRRWYPRAVCSACQSQDATWEPIALTGTVYSYTTTHQRTGFAFDSESPFTVGVIELDSGIRVVGQVRPAGDEGVAIGMRVVGAIEERSAGEVEFAIAIFDPVED